MSDSDSDSSWGSGSDREEEEIVHGNVFTKFGIGVTGSSGGKVENVKKSKWLTTEKAVEFVNGYAYNMTNLTGQLLTKFPPRLSALVPSASVLEEFCENEEFGDVLNMDDMTVVKHSPSSGIEITKKKFIVKPIWKYRFAATKANTKFRKFGQFANSQTQRKVTMLCQKGTQERHGEHNWENLKFSSLMLPLEDENYQILFIKPEKNSFDNMKLLVAKIHEERNNFVGLIDKEQDDRKMSEFQIPAVKFESKNLNVGTYLKRFNVKNFSNYILDEVSFEFAKEGKEEPKPAPKKYKEKYQFFKSELQKEVRNIREIEFVLDCPFLWYLVDKKNMCPLCFGRFT